MYNILDGRHISALCKNKYKAEILELHAKGITPRLVIILDDNNQANATYVRQKVKMCEELGISAQLFTINELNTEQLLIDKINELNNDDLVHGILVQLPLPSCFNEQNILASISPTKDVDCFNLWNIGYIWTQKSPEECIKPCTPEGIIALLKHYNLAMKGKDVVIVNRSNIVGKPLAALFLQENATVTLCHSNTANLKDKCKNADILVCGIGRAKFFDQSYIKSDAIVIDVSINRNEQNKLCGDVDVESLNDFSGWLTPVPGGVGPMTVTTVVKNLIFLTKKANKII